eukprot:614766-Prymnesium_polylepis.1
MRRTMLVPFTLACSLASAQSARSTRAAGCHEGGQQMRRAQEASRLPARAKAGRVVAWLDIRLHPA